MSDCQDAMDPDDTPVGAPGVDAHSDEFPLDECRLPGRRLLHVALLFVVVVPALVWLIRPASDDPAIPGGVAVDEPALDFTIVLFDGTRFALSDHLDRDGRPLVMNFWASWCVPCREEMPDLDAVARSHPEVYFLGVAVQDTEVEARAFAEEVGVSYPIGLDADGTITELYPILGLPTTRFITSDGTIAASWAGILDQARLESLIAEHLTG